MDHDSRLPDDVESAIYEVCLDRAPATRAEEIRLLQRQNPGLEEAIAELAERLLDGAQLLDDVGLHPDERPAALEEVPDSIGPYRVEEVLGRGGFGVVLRARQLEPVVRTVAIKLLVPGSATRRRLQRFEAERQILAEMSHPAIAQVFDAGITDDGRPFFVMEYVPGEPLNAYCDRQRLDVTARLRLFQSVCLAVQHAHERGIIHRDLKQQNFLAHDVNGKPHAKGIDFGIAKLLAGPAVGETRAGDLVGTPHYMSPEQARGDAVAADTRSDVYSLGVMLFELLTGGLPVELGDVGTVTPDELREAHQRAAPRPSSRLSTADTEPIAERRGTTQRRLLHLVRGDLDAITLTALHPEREQRYGSPKQLADDIDRYFARGVVEARPPTRTYRASRFVQRNRGLLLASSAAALLLAAGTVTSLVFASDARRNLEQFNQLALGQRLDSAESRLDELLPPWPETIPDLELWLREFGDPLASALGDVTAARDQLREHALPYADEDRARDAAASSVTRSLRYHRGLLSYVNTLLDAEPPGPDPEVVRAQLGKQRQGSIDRIAELERQPVERRTYRFERPRDQFLHDTLSALAVRLESFANGRAGAVSKCRNRIQRAMELQDRIVGPDAEAWTNAATELAADARFDGVELLPQPGLVPLGMDPDSGLQEFWHWDSRVPDAIPVRDVDGKLAIDARAPLVFVLIPGGVTWTGAQAESPTEPGYDPDSAYQARPTSPVTLRPFFLSKYEATKGQWMRLGGGRPSARGRRTIRDGRVTDDGYPVENVSWVDADALLKKWGLALPTEAQWEHACRATVGAPWPTGDRPESLQGHANLADRTAAAGGAAFRCDDFLDDGYGHYAPVGRFEANGFGLHDMIGNVDEWCADHHVSFAHLIAARDGDGLRPVPATGSRSRRGGSYASESGRARSSERSFVKESVGLETLGVRPARPLPPR